MKGASSVKLAFLVVLAASALSIGRHTVEGRHKNCHGGQQEHASPPQPESSLPPTEPPVLPPYQIHGCGYPCSDSNDCDWPCTLCCANQTCCYDVPMFFPWPPTEPPQMGDSSPPTEAPALSPDLLPPAPRDDIGVPLGSVSPAPAYQVPAPYQIHGCGYPCSDSNDCDSPCTVCCANQTCCYDVPMFFP